jgi:YjbE family integral membrane protein
MRRPDPMACIAVPAGRFSPRKPREIGVDLPFDWAALAQPPFWLAVGSIIWINILLSGDNAVVIAMASRGLPPRQRKWGIILGAAVAVLLRIVFTGIVARLLAIPFLKLGGGLALLWIAVKLVLPEQEPAGDDVEAAGSLWRAVQIVAIADLIMSLDNVIAIAAAAHGDTILIIFGLIVSIPLIVAGAALLTRLLTRFPVLVWAGAALLGWIAGEIMVEDPIVAGWLDAATMPRLGTWAAMAGAAFVVGMGYVLVRARRVPAV